MDDVFSPPSESVAPRSTGLAANIQEGMTSEPTMPFIGAVPDEWELYSDRAEDYTIGSPIGFGASSIVYAATYHPPALSSSPSNHRASANGIPCALKVLDLDSLPPRALHLLQRETTLMSLSKHPNVLRVRGSWMTGHKLYIALRLMNKGSAADVMRYGWPGGMEEDVVRCILRQALKGLNYLHTNGFIHRDIKAANLLIDDDGTVLLGDLGVAADLAEDTSRIPSSSTSTNMYSLAASTTFAQSPSAPTLSLNTAKRAVGLEDTKTPKPRIGKRKSFVGTPCWMSPELIQGKQYDSKADIWSFGITALELTQGRPPRSRESPQRVLLRTLQEDPPTLNRDGGVHKYSRAFKEMVDSCLAKDPAKRPTAEELLQTPFFKAAKKKSYLINTILKGLPPLTQRQERRVVQPLLSANSMDSWDFGLTLSSPTTSISRRSVLEKYVSAEDQEELQAHGIPIKTSTDEHRSKFNHHPYQLSTLPTEPPVNDFSDAEDDNNDQEFRSSSSQSSIVSSDVPLSQTSSRPYTSAPSSYASSSNLEQRLQAAEKKSDALAGSESQSLTPIAENHDNTLIGMKSVLGGRSVATPNNGKNPVPETPTLWSRLKSNVKRSASSKGHDPEPLDGSPHGKEKDKAKISMVSSKGLLSRSSTKSLARAWKEGK